MYILAIQRKGESRPISRVLSWTIIHLGYLSPDSSSSLPRYNAGHVNVPLFGLAPSGVYPATDVATSAVRSYRTISPLPSAKYSRRYIFCGTFHRFTPSRRYLALYPVEPGLSSPLLNLNSSIKNHLNLATERLSSRLSGMHFSLI